MDGEGGVDWSAHIASSEPLVCPWLQARSPAHSKLHIAACFTEVAFEYYFTVMGVQECPVPFWLKAESYLGVEL
eukprot:4212387-Amphidinium_carterae.1